MTESVESKGPAPMALRVVVVLVAAALLSSLVAPWGFYRLHWIAYLPLFWALDARTPRANRWLALLYAVTAEGLIFYWIPGTITLFSNIPWIVAMAIHGLFAVIFGSPYFVVFAWLHRFRERFGTLWILALPCWLVVVEWLAMFFILFPYNQGVSQYREPWVWQIASVTGVWGVSWLMLFFNAAFGEGIYRAREGRQFPARWAVSAVALVAMVVGFGAWRYDTVERQLAEAPVKRFLQVQSDHTMLYRMQSSRTTTYRYWKDVTDVVGKGQADVIVWPEGAVPFDLNSSTAVNMMWQVVDDKGADFLVGAGTREREPIAEMGETERVRIFNSVYFFGRQERQLPRTLETVEETLGELLRRDCDLDAMHVYTSVEAFALARVLGDREPECGSALRDREAATREGSVVDTATLEAIADDDAAWTYTRRYSARFDAPLKERLFRESRGVTYWWLEDEDCADNDCAFISYECREGRCGVYPNGPHYDKMVPLPFGEYLPLAETFPWIADLIKGPGNFRAGTEPLVFDGDGVKMAAPICYEGILGYVCDQFEDAYMLVNVTNDAWFGDTAASDLHGMLAAVRAVELGKPLFRSTYSGVSFVVEPHGRMYAETPLFTEVKRVLPVRVARVPTVYSVLGDWFVVASAGLLAGLWFSTRQRRGR